MAMVVDMNRKDGPVEVQFNVLNTRSEVVASKAHEILNVLHEAFSGDRDTIFSVLAKASEKLIEDDIKDSNITESKKAAS